MKQVSMKALPYLPEHNIPYRFPISHVQAQAEKTKLFWDKEGNCYDELLMTATLFNFDGKYVFWIGMDIGGISKAAYEYIYRQLCTVTNCLTKDTFIISGTHTHSGPWMEKNFGKNKNSLDTSNLHMEFAEHVANVAIKLFNLCKADMKEFEAELSVTAIDGVYSNRNSLDKPCDKNVNLIRFKEKNSGEMIGMWMQLSCHSTIIFPKNPKLSSDLVGNVRDLLSEHYGCVVMPIVGAAGDTSTRLTRKRGDSAQLDYDELKRLSNLAYEQIIENSNFKSINIDRFEVEKVELSYHYNLNHDRMKQRLMELDKQIEHEANPQQLRLLIQSKEGLKQKMNEPTDVSDTLVGRVWNLGELKFGVFPGELVSSLGKRIIQYNEKDVHLVLCYVEESVGYLVEIEEYGKNFESITSNIPIGLPEVLTEMIRKKLEEFNY